MGRHLLTMIALGAWSMTTQAQAQAPSTPPAAEVALPAPAAENPEDRVTPLAASRQSGRILSKNEAYNLGRLAEGRLGARLGNDMSYRVTGN